MIYRIPKGCQAEIQRSNRREEDPAKRRGAQFAGEDQHFDSVRFCL